jgi:hypothetical protein
VTIEPDTKDWTWVLAERCPECGLAAGDVDPTAIGARTRADLTRWTAVLSRTDARDRPAPTTWSPSEYACHVRDVYVLFRERLELMLTEDDPQFANWNQDETAIADDYASQDPVTVAAQLVPAGEALAEAFDSVPADAWDRTGRRDDGSKFTVATFGQYFLHDVVHHLHDVNG